MNSNEEFDDLARRKLEERSFPFQEADWRQARGMIDAQQGGKGRLPWYLGGAALLLLLGLATWKWSFTDGDARKEITSGRPVPAVAHAPGPHGTIQPGPSRVITAMPRQTAADRQSRGPGTQGGNGSEAHTAQLQHAVPGHQAAPLPIVAPGHAAHQQARPSPRADGRYPVEHAPTPTSPLEMSARADQRPRTTEVEEVSATQAGPEMASAQPTSTEAGVSVAEDPQPGISVQGMPKPGMANPPAAQASGAVDPPTATVANGTDAPSALATTSIAPIHPADTTAMGVASPSDSSEVSAPPAASTPAIPPLIPARAPWEISAMGGLFRAQTRYTGNGSAEWSGTVQGATSPSFAAELMHIGKHFGLGVGLHYGSYSERIHAAAIDRSTLTYSDHWHLLAVDTTILVITGTVPGTPPTYTGHAVQTTVNVLVHGTDTLTGTTHLRDARDQVNHVSYLEVPLLLDLHVNQGRWRIGLRGGPTIGVLTGRRGSVPAPGNEGYISFTDQPFREVTFGYTARAYVRYRFNAAWSAGVEPAMRGQLLNSFGSGELDRRAAAQGLLISLTYQLR